MINYLKMKPLFQALTTLSELKVLSTRIQLNNLIREFMLDYKHYCRTGVRTGTIGVFIDGVEICSISMDLINNYYSENFEIGNYWQHEGIKVGNELVLPLWGYSSNIYQQGSWDIYENHNLVAKVTQCPDFSDKIASALLCTYPKKWLKNLDINNDLFVSLDELTGYVHLKTNDPLVIEGVLTTLSSIGLHAFENVDEWNHSIRIGCSSIQQSPGVIQINSKPSMTVERARMYRFASIATDPFDAILRYWHVVEHTYDDLIYSNLQSILATSPRPSRFGKQVQELTGEAKCAKEVFVQLISDASFQQLCTSVQGNALEHSVVAVVGLLGGDIHAYSFWNKGTPSNGKAALGSLLYYCRNSVAHRRESERWFNRLDMVHHNSCIDFMPILHDSVHLMLQD